MLVKTRGIVLNYIKFRETSIISHVYTEQLGLQSYIVNGLRSKGPNNRIALFQPFTLLDLVVYDTRKGGINRISEFRVEQHFRKIPFDIYKGSVVLFLSEVVSRSIREEEPNPELFHFLHDSIAEYDRLESHWENFHLIFLIQLSRFLGFGPSSGEEITNQVSSNTQPGRRVELSQHPQYYEGLLDQLLREDGNQLQINGRIRRDLLALIIAYYQLHVDKLGEIRSLKVLSEVLSE